jgi:hypothetical protein
MRDAQLYLAIGIPSALFALNFIAILWQARGVERRIDSLDRSIAVRFDSLQGVMNAKFEAVDARFKAAQEGLHRVEQVIDARLKHLEER